ncbi:S-adenosyl-L-methionine-dependent methyltransferase [Phytophthora cactorum]|nr:S-adenosyl-L-methionine-dependent methyltransferase [Phytophthora cactorum]
MEFTCSTGRWLLDEDKPSSDGSEAPRYPFTVGMFPVASVSARRSKQIHGKTCNRLLQQLVVRCEDVGLCAYDFNTHEGFLKQIVLRRGVNGQGRTEIMLGLVTTSFDGEQSELLKRIVQDLVREHEKDLLSVSEAAPRLVSIVESLDSEAQRHRRRNDNEPTEGTNTERVLYGSSHFEDTILNHRFEISFDSFFQPNSSQASVLYRETQRMMAALPEKPVVWDLFCGVGSIGICMGAHAKKVLVEAPWSSKGERPPEWLLSRSHQFFCVDLAKSWQEEEFLDKIASTGSSDLPDMVMWIPLELDSIKSLSRCCVAWHRRHICYVSCNPHSQVPDLEAFCAKAKLKVVK